MLKRLKHSLKSSACMVAAGLVLYSYFLSANALPRVNEIRLSGSQVLIDFYDQAVQIAGSCSRFEGYDKPGFNHRGFVDLIVLCKALAAANYDFKLNISEAPAYKRAIKNTSSGRSDMMAELIWLDDIDISDFYITDPVIREREFEKGVFVLSDHPLASMDAKVIDLGKYRGISKRQWRQDWRVLVQLTPNTVNASSFETIFRMMKRRRADFSLFSFTGVADMAIESQGIKLVPVNGIKVQLSAARYFVVSKKSKQAKPLFKALNAGLASLRKKGEIKRIYQKSGFFNQTVKDWRVINPG